MDSLNDTSRKRVFVPALPTLWPRMLLPHSGVANAFPFNAPQVQFFYFARNAVWLAARMLGLQNCEVLAPAYHHGVEIEALVDAGATVRFYRIDRRWGVDLDDVDKKIGARTRALYLTHFAGFPGPTAEMRSLAEKRGLLLIEDCALSLLSSDGNRPLGTTGDVSVFCLYKTLPVPNGGALVINGPRAHDVLKVQPPPRSSTFNHSVSSLLQNIEFRGGRIGRWIRRVARSAGKKSVETAGIERVATGTQHFNRAHADLGMSSLSMRIARAQDFASIVDARRRNYFFLLGRLRDISPPLFNELPPGVCPLFYPLVTPEKVEVMARLERRGIDTVDFWRYFHPLCDPSQFPEAAKLRRTVLEIPCHQDLSPEIMGWIATAVREALSPQKSAAPSRARL